MSWDILNEKLYYKLFELLERELLEHQIELIKECEFEQYLDVDLNDNHSEDDWTWL